MTLGRKKRGWVSGDPPGSEKPRGKASFRRKGARDGGALTPTEEHQKAVLMRQFMKNPEGGGIGNSEAYRNSPAWCRVPGCNRLAHGHEQRREQQKKHQAKIENLAYADAGRGWLKRMR